MGAMSGSEGLLRAVTLLADPQTKRAVDLLLYRAGFETPAACLSVAALRGNLVRLRSDVVVVDLALCGLEGMPAVASLVRAAQQAAVLVVVPFEGLQHPAVMAGATAAATPLDLRPLIEVFDSVRAMAHAGLACDCCRVRSAARRRRPPSRGG